MSENGWLRGWPRVYKRPPHDSMPWVKVIVSIQRTSDGVVRRYVETCGLLDDDGDLETCNWRDGNNSCDCNRAALFARAGGDPDPHVGCSEGQYRVNLYNPSTGVCVYLEFTAETRPPTAGPAA